MRGFSLQTTWPCASVAARGGTQVIRVQGVDRAVFQLREGLVFVIQVLGGDLATFVGFGRQAVAIVQVVSDFGGFRIHHLLDPLAKAVIAVLGDELVLFAAGGEGVALPSAEDSLREGWQDVLQGNTQDVDSLWDEIDTK